MWTSLAGMPLHGRSFLEFLDCCAQRIEFFDTSLDRRQRGKMVGEKYGE